MMPAIRALHLLSAILMTAASIYIQVAFAPILTTLMEGMISMSLSLYILVQMELCFRWQGV